MADSTPDGSRLVILAKALLWLERVPIERHTRKQQHGLRTRLAGRALPGRGFTGLEPRPGKARHFQSIDALGLFLLVACTAPHTDTTKAPTLVFPTHLAEGSNPTALPASPSPAAAPDPDAAGTGSEDKGRPAGGATGPARTGTLPDPPPLRASNHYVYVIIHDHGQVSVQSVRRWRSRTPLPTARSMGRYAIELWIGRELVDRVRFDFPMLAAEPAPQPGSRRPLHEPPSLSAGAVVTKRVIVPVSQRATRAVLVDRATGVARPLPWPPPVQSSAADSSSAPH